jgi:hypothetical protein
MASVQKLQPVLYEVQQACILLGLPVPVGVYDSQDATSRMMGAAVNLAGIMVNDAKDWQSQRFPVEFVGDGLRTEYDLPPEFDRFVDQTGWSTANQQPVMVMSPQQWAMAKAQVGTFLVQPGLRVMRNKAVFFTAPQAGDTIRFEFINANWVVDGDDGITLKQYATKNADVPVWDWLLMVHAVRVKWLELKGMNTAAAQNDFTDRLAQIENSDQPGQVLSLNGSPVYAVPYLNGWRNVPSTGFGS